MEPDRFHSHHSDLCLASSADRAEGSPEPHRGQGYDKSPKSERSSSEKPNKSKGYDKNSKSEYSPKEKPIGKSQSQFDKEISKGPKNKNRVKRREMQIS